VRVVLDRVDPVQRRLQFSILEEVPPVRLAKAKTRLKSSGKAHPYIPPRNKMLRKGNKKGKNKGPGKKRS
jgi:preprotein translocase subunit SecA